MSVSKRRLCKLLVKKGAPANFIVWAKLIVFKKNSDEVKEQTRLIFHGFGKPLSISMQTWDKEVSYYNELAMSVPEEVGDDFQSMSFSIRHSSAFMKRIKTGGREALLICTISSKKGGNKLPELAEVMTCFIEGEI